MTNELVIDEHFQFGGLAALRALRDVFLAAELTAWSTESVLTAIDLLRKDEEIFSPEVVASFDATMENLEVFQGLPASEGMVS